MLYLVIFLLTIVSFPSVCQAQNRFIGRRASFFEKEASENKIPSCKSCKTGDQGLLQSVKKISSFQNDPVSADLSQTSVKLFIDPLCKHTKKAVEDLMALALQKQKVDCWIFVSGSAEEFRKFASENTELVKSQIAFSHDIKGWNSQRYGVTETPAFIIESKGKTVKASGQPDLLNILNTL